MFHGALQEQSTLAVSFSVAVAVAQFRLEIVVYHSSPQASYPDVHSICVRWILMGKDQHCL